MKRVLKFVTLSIVAIVTLGCAQNFYNIPKETYEKKVRVLGVAPIFVDAGSDIKHPEKEALLTVVKEADRQNERELVRMLKESGKYFSVRFVEGDAEPLFAKLLARKEKRDDAGIVYNKYFFQPQEVRQLITDNTVDALLVVVVSGISKQDKVSSSNLFSYLETNYNDLIMTAQILDADGTLLWEYPNFRQPGRSYQVLLPLQYPDFDEAAANETDKVEVKFKTIAGITRALKKKEQDLLGRELRVSRRYAAVFDDMMKLLTPSKGLFGGDGK